MAAVDFARFGVAFARQMLWCRCFKFSGLGVLVPWPLVGQTNRDLQLASFTPVGANPPSPIASLQMTLFGNSGVSA